MLVHHYFHSASIYIQYLNSKHETGKSDYTWKIDQRIQIGLLGLLNSTVIRSESNPNLAKNPHVKHEIWILGDQVESDAKSGRTRISIQLSKKFYGFDILFHSPSWSRFAPTFPRVELWVLGLQQGPDQNFDDIIGISEPTLPIVQ